MNRKLAVTIMFFFLGLATWDAFLPQDESRLSVSAEEGGVRSLEDGTPIPAQLP